MISRGNTLKQAGSYCLYHAYSFGKMPKRWAQHSHKSHCLIQETILYIDRLSPTLFIPILVKYMYFLWTQSAYFLPISSNMHSRGHYTWITLADGQYPSGCCDIEKGQVTLSQRATCLYVYTPCTTILCYEKMWQIICNLLYAIRMLMCEAYIGNSQNRLLQSSWQHINTVNDPVV